MIGITRAQGVPSVRVYSTTNLIKASEKRDQQKRDEWKQQQQIQYQQYVNEQRKRKNK